MQNALAVARREFTSYFDSPIAYLVVAVFVGVSGYLYFTNLFLTNQADMREFFALCPMLFVFLMPALTMRLLAEERAQGTLELLLTMPITDWQVVLGKFLASLGLVAVMLATTLPFAVSVGALGPLDKGTTFAGYVGLLFLGGGFCAIGLMASAFTRNQIVAFIITLAIGLTLWLVGKLVQVLPGGIAPYAAAISIENRFMNIARGVLDLRDVVYYVSLIGGCLLVAQTTLDSRRWR
jgi:ABC-2 type transport system permease protein